MDALKAIGGALIGTVIMAVVAGVIIVAVRDSGKDSGVEQPPVKVAPQSEETADVPDIVAPQPIRTDTHLPEVNLPEVAVARPEVQPYIEPTSAHHGLTICNKSREDGGVVLGYQEDDGSWITRGWYNLKQGECTTAIKENTSGRTYYYYAEGVRKGVWSGNYPLCIKPKEAFDITGFNDCEARGYKTVGFHQLKVADGVTSFTQELIGGTLSKIDGLDIGDGVYVQGFFSDELAAVVRIDKENNSVKVRRAEDGTTKWVSIDEVITREEAQMRDVGRASYIVACLFELVEDCKTK